MFTVFFEKCPLIFNTGSKLLGHQGRCSKRRFIAKSKFCKITFVKPGCHLLLFCADCRECACVLHVQQEIFQLTCTCMRTRRQSMQKNEANDNIALETSRKFDPKLILLPLWEAKRLFTYTTIPSVAKEGNPSLIYECTLWRLVCELEDTRQVWYFFQRTGYEMGIWKRFL